MRFLPHRRLVCLSFECYVVVCTSSVQLIVFIIYRCADDRHGRFCENHALHSQFQIWNWIYWIVAVVVVCCLHEFHTLLSFSEDWWKFHNPNKCTHVSHYEWNFIYKMCWKLESFSFRKFGWFGKFVEQYSHWFYSSISISALLTNKHLVSIL